MILLPSHSRSAVLTDSLSFDGVAGIYYLTFDQWNPEWGILGSASLTIDFYSVGGVLRFDNDGALPASGNVRFGADANIFSEDLTGDPEEPLTLTARAQSPLTPVSVQANDGDAEVGGTANFSSQGSDYAQVLGGSYYATRSGSITDYILSLTGYGTYTFVVEASQYVSASAFGGAQQQIDPSSVSGTITVTYNYSGSGPPPPPPDDPGPSGSAVPEPSTLSILLLSLSLFGYAKKAYLSRLQ